MILVAFPALAQEPPLFAGVHKNYTRALFGTLVGCGDHLLAVAAPSDACSAFRTFAGNATLTSTTVAATSGAPHRKPACAIPGFPRDTVTPAPHSGCTPPPPRPQAVPAFHVQTIFFRCRGGVPPCAAVARSLQRLLCTQSPGPRPPP
jgi:hypothetical protein